MLTLEIAPATEADTLAIFEMILELAEYERLAHTVVATEDRLRETLFGPRPAAEVLMGRWDGEYAGFALYFSTYSTFLGQAGMYLEDLYVKPHFRGRGIGRALLQHLAHIAAERGCGRLEWEVLDWNEPSIQFYKKLGAVAMDEWTRYRVTGEALTRLARSASV